jgi:hypothetical protein
MNVGKIAGHTSNHSSKQGTNTRCIFDLFPVC